MFGESVMIRRLRAVVGRWWERCDVRWRRALHEHWPSLSSPQPMDSARTGVVAGSQAVTGPPPNGVAAVHPFNCVPRRLTPDEDLESAVAGCGAGVVGSADGRMRWAP